MEEVVGVCVGSMLRLTEKGVGIWVLSRVKRRRRVMRFLRSVERVEIDGFEALENRGLSG